MRQSPSRKHAQYTDQDWFQERKEVLQHTPIVPPTIAATAVVVESGRKVGAALRSHRKYVPWSCVRHGCPCHSLRAYVGVSVIGWRWRIAHGVEASASCASTSSSRDTPSHCPTGAEELRHFLIKLLWNEVESILLGLNRSRWDCGHRGTGVLNTQNQCHAVHVIVDST